MWCSLCRTDVSVRTTGHAGGLLCSRCGHDLLSVSRPTDAIRQAREILERWNSSDLFERISRTESLDSLQTRIDVVKKSGAPQHLLDTKLLESASPQKSSPAEIAVDEPLWDDRLIEAQSIEPLDDTVAPQPPDEVLADEVLAHTDNDVPAGMEFSAPADVTQDAFVEETLINLTSVPSSQQVCASIGADADHVETTYFGHSPAKSDSESAAQEVEANEISRYQSQDDTIGSEASPPVAEETSDTTSERKPNIIHPASEISPMRKVAHAVKLSELTHIDVLSVTTVANSDVTGSGITSELQRVIELAKAQNADPQCIAGNDASDLDPDANTDKPADGEVSNVVQLTQSLQLATAAAVVSHANSEQCPPKPVETANASELLVAAVTKNILRNPMRRPLLHRRFQLERPATISSTGSENVNRKLRVDQLGGNNDVSDANAAQQDTAVASSVAPDIAIISNSPQPGRRFRIDGPESIDAVTGTDGRRGRTQTLPKHRYIDDALDSAMRGPHFEITAPRRSNLTSITGQFLAYLGVLGLTIGTTMVIYGHFGGYSEYTPTGWLVTTVAQMLLFLGVINLVSGGIEQNNDDVSRRINSLGEQLLRIEQVTSDAMKGPKLSPRLYDSPNAKVDAEETVRETAGVHRE